jgi:hypothetical protein
VPRRQSGGSAHWWESTTRKDISYRNAHHLEPEIIAGISIKVVYIQHCILSDDELIAFLQFRDYLTLITTAAAVSRTSKEIKQSFTCGSGSRIASMFHAHHAPAADGPNHKADAHLSATNKPATPNGQTQ